MVGADQSDFVWPYKSITKLKLDLFILIFNFYIFEGKS